MYFFLNTNLTEFIFPSYVIPSFIIGIISGLFICYNFYIFSIAIFFGQTIQIVFSYLLIQNLDFKYKISSGFLPIFLVIFEGTLSYYFERIVRILFYHSEENKERMNDLIKLFNVFPNEVLLISEDKSVFTNTSFKTTFISTNDHQMDKEISYQKVLNIATRLICEEDKANLKLVLKDFETKAEEYQTKLFSLKDKEVNENKFTYKCARLEFHSLKSIVLIFSNLSVTLELEKEKHDKTTKRILISQITHDMRTPLNSMLCSEEMLESTNLNLDQKDIVNLLKESTQMLLNLVNDSLDLYLNEDRSLKASCSLFDPINLFKQCLQLLNHSFKSKGVALKLNIKNDIPRLICSDENRLRRIIINLLGNALKFTPKNGYVRLKSQFDEDNQMVIISVKDSGPGIAEKHLQNLFTRLNKLKEHDDQNLTGLGIGLSVCKTLSNLLGGDIRVSSRINHGTKFTFWILSNLDHYIENKNESHIEIAQDIIEWSNSVLGTESRFFDHEYNTLPLTSEALPIEENKEHPDEEKTAQIKIHKDHLLGDTKSKKVLIVDDNVSTVDIISSYCKRLNMEFDKCYDGSEAVDLVKKALSRDSESIFDYIIMDNQMSKMDGIDALREIQSILINCKKKPTFIILSGE